MSENDERMTEDDENGGFKIEDRRQFTAQGDPIAPGGESASVQDAAASEPVPAEPPEAEEPEAPREEPGLPDVDFAGFLLSLATSAMAHLGEVPDPATGATTENLAAAKQMIDILSILQEKTKGNLEPDEDRLLDNLLYELRMKFLNKTKGVIL